MAAEVVGCLRRERKARKTIQKRLWLYRVLTKDLRALPIADITAGEILTVIQMEESCGKLESALRLRAAIGQVMKLAVATDRRAVVGSRFARMHVHDPGRANQDPEAGTPSPAVGSGRATPNAWRITRRNSDGLCFPGLWPGRPISENTVNMALRALGFGSDEHCAHGFCAMASTILNERSSFERDVIEKALSHQEPNAVKRRMTAPSTSPSG